jgi:hypothetical protein
VARAGNGARAGGVSACALFGLEGLDLRIQPVILIPPERRVRSVDFRVRRSDVPSQDRAIVRGIPAVTPAWALIGAAGELSPRASRVAVDSARRKGLLTVERLERRALLAGATPGGRCILRLVGSGALEQESEGERAFARFIGRLDPPVEWQVEILPGIRPDALWRDAAMTFEYEGRDRHTGMVDLEHDLPRLLAIEAAGWDVTRVTNGMLEDAERTFAAIRSKRKRRLGALALDPSSHPLAARG